MTGGLRARSVHVPAGAAPPRHRPGPPRAYVRPLAGLTTVVVIAGIIALALTQFRGGFTETVPVTVLSDRVGLMMNPGAKVKLHGAPVGTVASIADMPNGQAAIRLAIDPSRLHLIPANVLIDIVATTAFGAKFIQLIPPEHPSPQPLRAGQVLDAGRVTVEINTVFKELTSVLAKIDPAKLNETLGAIATSLNGRGGRLGQLFSDLNAFLAKIEPSLPNLRHDLADTADVSIGYADAAGDLVKTIANTTRVSQSIVDEERNLDAFLISTIGLADIGNDVVGTAADRRGLQLLWRHQQPDRVGGRWIHSDIADPPACTVGFLPPSQWRSPADTTEMDTPDKQRWTPPTICTANSRKTPPSPCAVCATTPAWATPESGPRPSRSATATSPMSRSPCASTRWGRLRWIPT